MKNKNNCDTEFEKLVIRSMIFEYIDKYIKKIPYKMLKLTGKQWVQNFLDGYL